MAGPDALDYSFSRPSSPAALRNAGIRLVCRYLSWPGNNKNLTAGEFQGLLAAGIGVLPNWESDAGRALQGAGAGATDGVGAYQCAEAVGIPHGRTIYFSVDTDTNPSQWPTIAAYLGAARQSMAGRYYVSAYGESTLIDWLSTQGVIPRGGWVTYAWSGGQVSSYAGIYQYLNGQSLAGAAQVDFDRLLHPEWLNACWPPGLDPSGGGDPLNPVPSPDNPGDEDMGLNPDEDRVLTRIALVQEELLLRLQSISVINDPTKVGPQPIAEAIWNLSLIPAVGGKAPAALVMGELQAQLRTSHTAEIVAAIIAALPHDTGSLDTAAITAAVDKGFSDLTISITKGA